MVSFSNRMLAKEYLEQLYTQQKLMLQLVNEKTQFQKQCVLLKRRNTLVKLRIEKQRLQLYTIICMKSAIF